MKQKKERKFEQTELDAVYKKILGHTKDDPIHSSALHASPATARTMIGKLRRQGKPICSNQGGYFIAETAEEFMDTIKYMEALKQGMEQTLAAMYGTYNDIVASEFKRS